MGPPEQVRRRSRLASRPLRSQLDAAVAAVAATTLRPGRRRNGRCRRLDLHRSELQLRYSFPPAEHLNRSSRGQAQPVETSQPAQHANSFGALIYIRDGYSVEL